MTDYTTELCETLRTSEPAVWRPSGEAEFFSEMPPIVGYVVVWNVPSFDKGGYRMRYGQNTFLADTFKQTAVDILHDHCRNRVLGRVHLVDSDFHGLWVEGSAAGNESSRFMWRAISSGALSCWSIGYKHPKCKLDGVVDITRGRLGEVSLTHSPANPNTVARLRPRWANVDRLRDLLIIANASLADMSDDDWLTFQASKSILRQCELSGAPIPKSPEALQRRAELCLAAA
ncbi:MAG: hypothetical protein CMJ84_14315 [Planctomycetes bacterium]|nr:hypothetical protein [Planctomycetota bacterium]